jgi:hypothetical protein
VQTDDLHDWISFADPDEDRTWLFDATFLRSNWTCIYGRGCQGILDRPTPELSQGCCSLGAHFVDDDDRGRVEKAAARLTDQDWQYKSRANGSFFKKQGKDTMTRIVDGACIFLNRPGFPGGPGCALHVGAERAGDEPLTWKPDVCWQLPIRLEEHTDDHSHTTTMLREWKRRDWGEGGDDFAWWCTSTSDAFVGSKPVYRSLKAELIEMIGEQIYDMLVDHLRRPQPLPHPVLRKR